MTLLGDKIVTPVTRTEKFPIQATLILVFRLIVSGKGGKTKDNLQEKHKKK